MATHLAAWSTGAAGADTATLTALANVTDQVLTRSGTLRYFVPGGGYGNVKWAIATGPSLTRAQIVSPSIAERRMNLEVAPRRRGASTLTLTSPEVFLPKRAIPLTPGEELEFQTAEDGAGLTVQNGFVALGLEPLPPMPDGPIRVIRFTATTTLTAFAWTLFAGTADSTPVAGTYHLVGFVPISANVIVARARLRGQTYRPGMPGLPGAEGVAADFDAALFNDLMYYDMGEFFSNELPEWEFFASVADTSETIYAYVIRTGELPAPT